MSCNFLNTLAAYNHSGGFNIWDVLLDALIDSAKMLPFLFLAFLLMEFIEHRAGDKLVTFLRKSGGGRAGGAALGAVAGCVPQCGFSVAAANLYAGRVITMGTLISVFISTSDEAIPILLAHPERIGAIWRLIAAKIIIAAAAGIITDIVIKALRLEKDSEGIEDICTESGCGCGSHGIWYSSLKHTVNIFAFILIVNIVFGMIMAFAGENTVKNFLGGMGIFQPVLSGIIGMIPNCAASVLITELYAEGAIAFGSAVSGLCAGAGMGLAVLFRTNKNIRENLVITGMIYAVGVLSGMVLMLISN